MQDFLSKIFTEETIQYMERVVKESPDREYIWNFLVTKLDGKINFNIIVFTINELHKNNEFTRNLYMLYNNRDKNIYDEDTLLKLFEDIMISNFMKVRMPDAYNTLFIQNNDMMY